MQRIDSHRIPAKLFQGALDSDRVTGRNVACWPICRQCTCPFLRLGIIKQISITWLRQLVLMERNKKIIYRVPLTVSTPPVQIFILHAFQCTFPHFVPDALAHAFKRMVRSILAFCSQYCMSLLSTFRIDAQFDFRSWINLTCVNRSVSLFSVMIFINQIHSLFIFKQTAKKQQNKWSW